MNRIRFIIAAGIIGTFIWLNWWIVPPMGLFHMSLSDPPLPENGYALVFFQEGKSINAATLNMLKTGWSVNNLVHLAFRHGRTPFRRDNRLPLR